LVDVGIRELKARLSEYLGRVMAGDEVVVTDRGVPIVRLVPFVDRTLQQGFEQGWIEAPRRELPGGLPAVERHRGRMSTIEALDEDRG
jgi:prevent-host-death family protein